MMAAIALLVLSACSGSASRAGQTVDLTEWDFRITPAESSVAAGPVEFVVTDRGPSTHEFVVMRTDLPAAGLPLQANGLTVDEESPLLRDVGEINEVSLDSRQTLVLDLAPGRYVVLCNLEGHYLGGMHAVVEVGAGDTGGA